MAHEIEMTFQFTTAQDRDRMRVEQRAALEHYESENRCTLIVKSDTAKHYTNKLKPGPDYWVNTTILEVYDVERALQSELEDVPMTFPEDFI